ncbi:unnamed protein product, partial [Brenthis ino]
MTALIAVSMFILRRDPGKLIRTSTEVKQNSHKNNDLLMKRKLWSRWGKWGECSVTCGEGTISRRRHCVSGRCAPGEFEEQRRLCSRPPCMMSSDVFDDPHY